MSIQNKNNLSYLILPAVPVLIFILYFCIKKSNTLSKREEIVKVITLDYENNLKEFSVFFNLINKSHSVWNKFDIHFHPGLGTKFHGYGYLDSTKISEESYLRKYSTGSNKIVNELPDFDLDESILFQIKQIGISKIEYESDSLGKKIKFLYKYRTFDPSEYDYYIIYTSHKLYLSESNTLWINKINDSIFCEAVKSN